MKSKKITGILFIISLVSLASCGDIYDNTYGKYVDDEQQFEGFVNPEKEKASFDEKFTIDGMFNEEEYQDLIWWEETYESAADEVNVKATSYFGEKGVFMGFDVDDHYVYVNPLRSSYKNSGLEIYIGKPGATSLAGNAFEIDLLPNNTIHPRLYFNGTYSQYLAPYEKAPYIGTTLKGGNVNTSACKGYCMEIYLPYEYLFNSTEKPEYINVNIALLRATSADKNNVDRLWYNFGEVENSSYNWSNPETYWKFDGRGLVANKIKIECNELGNIYTEKSYVTNFSDAYFNIAIKEGNYLKSLTNNGIDVTSQIKYDENDKPYYIAKKVTEDIQLSATFANIDGDTNSLSGRLTFNNEKLSKEIISDLKVKFRANGVTYNGSLYDNGNYLFRNIPLTKGYIEIYSNQGYKVFSQNIDFNTVTSNTLNINLSNDDYGENRIIKIDTVESINGARKTIYQNEILNNPVGSNFVYSFNLKYDGKLFDENGVLVSDPSYGTHPNKYSAFNLNGNMVNKSNTDTGSFNMQIMHWNANGYWMIKLWVDGKAVNVMLGLDFLKDLNSRGVDLILVNENRKITVYQSLNGQLFKLIEHSSSIENKEWYLNDLTCYGENAMVNSSWSVSNSKLSYNKVNEDLNSKGSILSLDSHHQFKLEENKTVQTSVCWNSSDIYMGGFTSNLIIPNVIKEDNTINTEKFIAGFRCHLYNDKDQWFGLYIYVFCDGSDYYVSADNSMSNPNTKVKLNSYQINQLAMDGLLIGYYKNNNQVSFFVENESELVEIATLQTINTASWYANQHTLKYIDLVHNGNEGLGYVYTENTKVYSFNVEISKNDFFQIIGDQNEQ